MGENRTVCPTPIPANAKKRSVVSQVKTGEAGGSIPASIRHRYRTSSPLKADVEIAVLTALADRELDDEFKTGKAELIVAHVLRHLVMIH